MPPVWVPPFRALPNPLGIVLEAAPPEPEVSVLGRDVSASSAAPPTSLPRDTKRSVSPPQPGATLAPNAEHNKESESLASSNVLEVLMVWPSHGGLGFGVRFIRTSLHLDTPPCADTPRLSLPGSVLGLERPAGGERTGSSAELQPALPLPAKNLMAPLAGLRKGRSIECQAAFPIRLFELVQCLGSGRELQC